MFLFSLFFLLFISYFVVSCRVRVERNGGAWCPRQQATHQPRDWLEIDLKSDHVITAVETQGKEIIRNGWQFICTTLYFYNQENQGSDKIEFKGNRCIKITLDVSFFNANRFLIRDFYSVVSTGRFGNGQGQEFAEHFLLEYWRESLAKWVRYKDLKGEEVRAVLFPIFFIPSKIQNMIG